MQIIVTIMLTCMIGCGSISHFSNKPVPYRIVDTHRVCDAVGNCKLVSEVLE